MPSTSVMHYNKEREIRQKFKERLRDAIMDHIVGDPCLNHVMEASSMPVVTAPKLPDDEEALVLIAWNLRNIPARRINLEEILDEHVMKDFESYLYKLQMSTG